MPIYFKKRTTGFPESTVGFDGGPGSYLYWSKREISSEKIEGITLEYDKSGYQNFVKNYQNCFINQSNFISTIGITPLRSNPSIQKENICEIESRGCDFLKFAELPLHSNFWLSQFVKENGFLTNHVDLALDRSQFKSIKRFDNEEEIPDGIKAIHCEPISIWYMFQYRLRTLIKLWRFLTTSDQKFKAKYKSLLFKKEKEDILFLNFDLYRTPILDEIKKDINFEEVFSLKLNDLKRESTEIKRQRIPRRFLGGIGGLTVLNPYDDLYNTYANDLLIEQLQIISNFENPRLVFPKEVRNFSLISSNEIKYVYETLWQGLIIQFIEAVFNDHNFCRCIECGEWLLKTFKGGKSGEGKNYCSVSCRNSAYRRRSQVQLLNEHETEGTSYELLEKYKKPILEFWRNKNKKSLNEFLKIPKKKNLSAKVMKSAVNSLFLNYVNGTSSLSISEHLGLPLNGIDSLLNEYNKETEDISINDLYLDWDTRRNQKT